MGIECKYCHHSGTFSSTNQDIGSLFAVEFLMIYRINRLDSCHLGNMINDRGAC